MGEILSFDEGIKDLCTTWLLVCPHTYFNELFLETRNWNKPIADAFANSGIHDAQSCFYITQAYYLSNLKQLRKNSQDYRNVPIRKIETEIRNKMTYGKEILETSAELTEEIKNIAAVEEYSLSYIKKIMSLSFFDKDERDSRMFEIWKDSMGMLALSMFTTESIKKAKEIDKQFKEEKP
jgi:hypothetical protein